MGDEKKIFHTDIDTETEAKLVESEIELNDILSSTLDKVYKGKL